MTKREVPSTPCHDCGVDTTPCRRNGKPDSKRWEWYMVQPKLWASAGMKSIRIWQNDKIVCVPCKPGAPHAFLCIGCLETRVGRRLTRADFINAPVNDPAFFPHSKRLTEMLTT